MDFLQYGLILAHAAAMRSPDRFVKVGSVAFDKDKRVLATGYNGLKSGFDMPDSFHEDRDLRRKFYCHSEANTLSQCKRKDPYYLFLTMSPCKSCAMHITAYDIKEVYFSEIYDKCDAFKEIFDFYKIKWEVVKPNYYIDVIQSRLGK